MKQAMLRVLAVVQLLALSSSSKLNDAIVKHRRLHVPDNDWPVDPNEDPDISSLGFAQEIQNSSLTESCVDLAMWSRGFARECCDLTPKCIKVIGHGPWYEGSDDTSYFQNSKLSEPGVVVYVSFGNLPAFVSEFLKLPASASVTLVTGQEDFCAPREIWGGEGRDGMKLDFPIKYMDFIKDSRLKHWFTQNYDLTGCNPFSGCSMVDIEDDSAKKVSPLPIGVDFHTRDEKSHEMKSSMQMQMLVKVRKESSPLSKRDDNTLYMPFTATNPIRKEIIDSVPDKLSKKLTDRVSLEEMWKTVGAHRYVVCPIGHGLDTHRLWEVMNLGSIPVVKTSSLDLLYDKLPIIIVDSWKSVNEKSFAQWNQRITDKFGELDKIGADGYPAANMRFWYEKIRATAQSKNSHEFQNTCETGRPRDEWKC